jgi:hypothetical protein
MGSFQNMGQMSQMILGSYASNMGKVDNDLSGKAIIESATNNNAAAMPYVTGYLQAWSHLGCVVADLMPKYFKGKRKIPVVSMAGERDYKDVGGKEDPRLDYQQNSLNVCIEAGVNFSIQKNQALAQITSLMQASEQFNQFINSPKGLPVLISNLTCYGADQLQAAIPQFLQEQQQQQQQAMQMQQQQMQQDPRMIKAQADVQKVQMQGQELQMKEQQNQMENQFKIAELSIEKEIADAKVLEAEAKVSQAQVDSAVRLEESQTSLEVHSLEAATKMAEIQSRHHDMAMNEHSATLNERKLEHEMKEKPQNGKA